MQTRTTVDPDLVYMGRHIDASIAISCRFSRHCGTYNLHADIQNCWVERITIKLGIRPVGYLHLTQHICVASPQLCNALEERTIVDTVFAESQIIILPRYLLRATGLDFFKHRLPRK